MWRLAGGWWTTLLTLRKRVDMLHVHWNLYTESANCGRRRNMD
jgi:hypothetical protein